MNTLLLRQLSSAGVAFAGCQCPGGARTLPTINLAASHAVPDTVDRVVVLQHQTLNLLVQMNATDKIVGVMARTGTAIRRRLRAPGAGTGAKFAGRFNAR